MVRWFKEKLIKLFEYKFDFIYYFSIEKSFLVFIKIFLVVLFLNLLDFFDLCGFINMILYYCRVWGNCI